MAPSFNICLVLSLILAVSVSSLPVTQATRQLSETSSDQVRASTLLIPKPLFPKHKCRRFLPPFGKCKTVPSPPTTPILPIQPPTVPALPTLPIQPPSVSAVPSFPTLPTPPFPGSRVPPLPTKGNALKVPFPVPPSN